MNCVILYRHRSGFGEVEYVSDAETPDRLCVFEDENDAETYAASNQLFQSGQVKYQIVRCEDL